MNHLSTSILLFIVLFLHPVSLRAQTEADSLLNVWELEKHTAGYDRKISLLLDLTQIFRYTIPDSSLFFCSQGLELARSEGDRHQEVFFTYKKGAIYYTLGDYDIALDYFFKGLEVSREIDDRKMIAVGLNNMGLIYNMHDQDTLAIENHRQSIAICREIGDTLLWARNLHNMGICYDNMKDETSALVYADSALATIPSNASLHEPYPIRIFKGWVLFKLKQYDQAEEVFQRVLSDNTYTNEWEISYALLGLASIHQKRENIDQSIRYGIESLKLAQKVNALWDLQLITKLLSENYEKKADYKKAYQYQLVYKTYSDTLFHEAKKKITYLRLRHQLDENVKLAQENELKQQHLDRKNIQLIMYSVGLILLIVLALILYQKVVQKNRLNREMAQLNATKDILFHIIAHDIKSPMSIMISFTELLQEDFDDFSKTEILKIIDRLNKSSREGLQLLENLLDWAKSQTGKLIFNPASIPVKMIVGDTLKLMAGNAAEKKIEISTAIPEDLTCFADKNMTSVILRNLISNAIKFTSEQGRVSIRAKEEKGVVTISVSDNGVGISREEIGKLFHIETTFTTIGTNHEKGSGIGLMLCKEFISKQGGSIGVESEPGKGSRFWFTLPVGKQEVRQDY